MVPPKYYLTPSKKIMEANPLTGLVDVPTDEDGSNRLYNIIAFLL